jgi:hypothetical protein
MLAGRRKRMVAMRKAILFLLLSAVALGCGSKKHPVKVVVDPEMSAGQVEKIAVFPFTSAVHHSDDPDKLASKTMDRMFREELDTREDYNFIAPSSVTYGLEREDLTERGEAFVKGWTKNEEIDAEFLRKIYDTFQVDAVLIGVVDLWQKDEVDVQENATPTTYVGATVTVLGTQNGKVLFQASDEDFVEGARSEDRTVLRSGSGQIYSDPRGGSYRATEYEDVAVKVVKALVSSIPAR